MKTADFEKELKSKGLYADVARICRESGVTLDELVSPSKRKPLPRARGKVYLWLRDERGYSLVTIGKLFNRPHNSVLSAIQSLDGGT